MSEMQPSTRIIYAGFDFFGKHHRQILGGVVAVAALFVLGSGFYIVKKEQLGVLTRFGKVVDDNVDPGWHYAIPFVDRAHIRKVKRVVRHRIASREGGTVNFTLLSGDTNLLEVDLALQYRIDNLRAWLFASSDPLLLVTMLVRERLVNLLGHHFIDLILTSNRNLIERHLLGGVAAQLESLDVGVELVALNIVDVQPIEETRFAFRDVSDAIAERAQAVSMANAKRERLIARSKGQAEAMVLSAKAKARERIVQAKAAGGAFTALLSEYRKNPTQVAITRYWQRMRMIFNEASLAAVNPGNESTIDINMIDDAGGFIPADLALGAPPSGAVSDRPGDRVDKALAPSTARAGVHTVETVESDRHLMSGRYHQRRSERDHMRAANPRSLIFDTPSIFSHRHPAGREGAYARQADLRPMSETMSEEERRRSGAGAGEGHAQTRPGGSGAHAGGGNQGQGQGQGQHGGQAADGSQPQPDEGEGGELRKQSGEQG